MSRVRKFAELGYPQKAVNWASYPRINSDANSCYPRINGDGFTHKR
jgi:hypothetical protein